MMIVDIVKEVVEPEMIILFGSYAQGKHVEHRYTDGDGMLYKYISDFDFLLVTRENTVKEHELGQVVNARTEHLKQPIIIQMHDID